MNGEPAQPDPAQVPMLTEVIELVHPIPVAEAGMSRSPRAVPAAGSPAAAPIVTGGLGAGQRPSWSPMNTVVVPTLSDVAMPPAVIPAHLALPVLDAVVPEELTGSVALTQLDAAPEQPAQAVVVHLPGVAVPPVAQASHGDASLAPMLPASASAPPPQAVPPGITEAQLAQRVLGVVQKQIDGMIDFRLKEALAPILARHSEALVRDLREELSRTMSDVVARAVAQEMARLRHR